MGFGRNRISLYSCVDGQQVSHFTMREFENSDGLVMVHKTMLLALELVHRDLNLECGGDLIGIMVTDAVRTGQELERLAKLYGWIGEQPGGRVSRDSRHLVRYGGIAVDFQAWTLEDGKIRHGQSRLISMQKVASIALRYFDWVKVYSSHVHGDQRYGAQKVAGL